jgi:hypothetical protein
VRELLASGDEHGRKAAAKLIELGLTVVELTELERRVAELEQRQTLGESGQETLTVIRQGGLDRHTSIVGTRGM